MNLTDFVNGYLYPFLYDIVHAAGGSDSDVSGLYYFFRSLIDNDITGLVIPLLAGPIGVWYALKFSLSSILRLVYDITNFVNTFIVPVWNALVSDVLTLIQWVANAGGFIWQIAVAVFNQLSAPFLSAIRFAQWLLWNGYNILVSLIWDTWNFFYNHVWPLIQAFFSPYTQYVNWLIQLFNLARNFLISFVQDPVGFILYWARQLFNALIAPFMPLLQFFSWWSNYGARTLVAFVNDPVTFILNVIAPRFISWIVQLIANNW